MSVLTTVAKVQALARQLQAGKSDTGLTATWGQLATALDSLVADQAALYAAAVAVSAVEGEASSKAITDAAITASDTRMA